MRMAGLPLLHQPGELLHALVQRDLVAEQLGRSQLVVLRRRLPGDELQAVTCRRDIEQLAELGLLRRGQDGRSWAASGMAYGIAHQVLGRRASKPMDIAAWVEVARALLEEHPQPRRLQAAGERHAQAQ